MEFNTLEIIGLAFLAGLNIAEIAEEKESETEEIKCSGETEESCREIKCDGKHCKNEKETDINIAKLEKEDAKEFIDFIEKITGEEN